VSLSLLVFAAAVQAAPLDLAIEQAAETHEVPAALLVALAFEASHFDAQAASAWGGYGLYDFREDDESFGPGIERVSALLGQSPDNIMASPELQVQGAAALLAWHAEGPQGALPDPDDLSAWAPAVMAFSGRQEPEHQALFVSYIYELLEEGIDAAEAKLIPQEHVHSIDALDWLDRVLPPPMASTDYSGAVTFTSAHSSNYSDYSRGTSEINYVIIHTVQGSYSGCISWFANSSANVSAHYVVRSSDGQVTQMVREEDVGWHAGNWSYNEQSVGIEHEGYVDDPGKWYTTAMYSSSAALTSDIADRNSIPLDRTHIIGHVEVPGATHTDPGTGWDWSTYMDLLGGDADLADATLLGVVADGDIYNGERLVGAQAKLVETGETVSVDSDGYYRFTKLSPGEYTVQTTMDGYQTGSCTQTVETGSGSWWCSIAMDPGESQDTGPVDTGTPQGDTGDSGVGPPGARVALGCSAVRGNSGLAFFALAGLLLLRRRRS